MPYIHVLDEPTINQIAAGEVVERPSAVVKELIENAMDAGATAITAEIKEGGLSFIRITDNGAGIAKEDIPLAFLRHATSKIRTAEDLLSVTSLGFRGEALSSIAAVAQVELITKTPSALNGFRYIIEGGDEKSMEEIGCPGGTTFIVRNLFYNTPARRKFLKSAMTEAGYIGDLMERLIVSHPNVSFKFIMNNQVKLQSSGNNNSKDILYHIYGRDISKELLSIEINTEDIKMTGFIGKPVITRGNRNFENYFINGRYIKSNVITKAIEEAYKPFMMQHKYPFTSIYFEIAPSLIDVNVHPQKMEIRLKNSEEVYQITYQTIRDTLAGKEMIPKVTLIPVEESREKAVRMPEPFEQNRRKEFENTVVKEHKEEKEQKEQNAQKEQETISALNSSKSMTENQSINEKNQSLSNSSIGIIQNLYTTAKDLGAANSSKGSVQNQYAYGKNNNAAYNKVGERPTDYITATEPLINSASPLAGALTGSKNGYSDLRIQETNNTTEQYEPQIISTTQMNLFTAGKGSEEAPFLSKKALEEHRIIGQVFSTYWLVEYKKELYIIDQHAAHEKVLYERIMSAAKEKTYVSQQLLPPIVLTLTLREQEVLRKQDEILKSLGYEIEHFGGKEYSVRAVPADLYSISERDLLMEFIDSLAEDVVGNSSSTLVLERAASLSCKAAVKANHSFSYEEATALIKELLTLDNPYHCPHGRPVIISMSQYELERKFKRIV